MESERLPGPAERAALWQQLLNARPIPPRGRQRLSRHPIEVIVRLVWERDGVEHLTTLARDWVDHDVLIDLPDQRWHTGGVWLDASDVTRLHG